jgi:SAM-dependent methyltransferase
MQRKDHWERVYSTRIAEKLGWYKPQLDTSLAWLEALGLDKGARIIDVGGGASTLVDDLIDAGYESLTVLDIADSALAATKKRLGRQSELVMWLSGDITEYRLPAGHFDLWHDRALLHFLTEAREQRAYRDNLVASLRPGGHVIMGVFAPEAPPRCSGLPVVRYSHEELAERLGPGFELERHRKELHLTPGGVEQMYLYCQFKRSKAD